MLNYKFDIIGISETKIRNGIAPTYDINIKGYNTYLHQLSQKKEALYYILLITLITKLGKILTHLCTNQMNLNLYLLKILIQTKKYFMWLYI